MTLRDRILALVREASFVPADEPELARRLGLPKKQRSQLKFEVRQLLRDGRLARGAHGRLAAPAAAAPKATAARGAK
ncbi:MAG TPA: hypothetical protein PLB90_05365, partial [Opitutaceae bacterium]|nr:hypothetical protein [Opitutaceae bacterium]